MASRPGRQIGKVRGLKSRCSQELAGSIPAPGIWRKSAHGPRGMENPPGRASNPGGAQLSRC